MKLLRSIPGLLLLTGASALSTACLQDAPVGNCTTGTVETTNGPVCGNLQTGGFPDGPKSEVSTFLGIPFAADTGGANRFKAPQPVAKWTKTKEALSFGFACPQAITAANPFVQPVVNASFNEDCLSINVWTPEASTASKREVMLFIYGGAFIEGASNLPLQNGKNLAAGGDVVVVSMNYRVGSFGFMANNDWGLEGNMGILDQQAAMRWVRDNIAHFGGDPDKVMLFGESAGAMSVGIHQIAKGSEGLFRSSLMESNPYGLLYRDLVEPAGVVLATPPPGVTPPEVLAVAGITPGSAANNAEILANATSCKGTAAADMIACLRTLGTAEIMKAQETVTPGFSFVYMLPWTPVVSPTGIIQKQPNTEDFAVPVVMGTNTNEGVTFGAPVIPIALETLDLKTFTKDAFIGLMFVFFGPVLAEHPDLLTEIPNRYEKYSVDGVWDNALYAVFTDYIFACGTEYVYENAKSTRFLYQFNQVASYDIEPALKVCFDESFVCHAFELPWVFGNGFSLAIPNLTDHFDAKENSLSTTMQGYWTQFTKTMDPNHAGAPTWSQKAATKYQLLNTEITQAAAIGSQCEFWNTIGYDVP
jgi:carboxylesterase type B